MIRRIAVILLLCSASLPLMAREVRQAGANGDGGCPSAVSGQNRGEAASASATQRRADSDSLSREKPAASPQGGNTENSVRGPRMHSFLPGMFR